MTNNNLVPEAWNRAEILDRLGGDEELFRELIQIFVQESPKIIQQLREAVASSNAEGVKRGAHSIKGEVSCLGGVAAAETAQRLETMGSNKELAGASETFHSLERELQELKQMLVGSVPAQ